MHTCNIHMYVCMYVYVNMNVCICMKKLFIEIPPGAVIIYYVCMYVKTVLFMSNVMLFFTGLSLHCN